MVSVRGHLQICGIHAPSELAGILLQNAEESHSETSAKYETVLETVQDQEEAELKKLPASIKSEGFLQDRKRIRVRLDCNEPSTALFCVHK